MTRLIRPFLYFVVPFILIAALYFYGYSAGKTSTKLERMQHEEIIIKKARDAEHAFDRCVAARGIAHCVPDSFERKD